MPHRLLVVRQRGRVRLELGKLVAQGRLFLGTTEIEKWVGVFPSPCAWRKKKTGQGTFGTVRPNLKMP